jgi:hypothetical protein
MGTKCNHPSLIRELPTNVKAERTQWSNAKGLRHLVVDFAPLLICSIALRMQPPFWPLLQLSQGSAGVSFHAIA